MADQDPCRRDETADNGDCGDQLRCGVDERCHPLFDAGAIACSYEADFADCTNGWRCSFNGVCLDPAEEALEPWTRQLTSPQLIRTLLPAVEIAAMSRGDTKVASIATLDDAGVLQLFRRVERNGVNGLPQRAEDFTGHTLEVTRFPLPGVISAPIGATNEGAVFFHDGLLLSASIDGGSWLIRTSDGGVLSNRSDAGQHSVSELRPLSEDRFAAFRPDGGGYWAILPFDGGASWVPQPGLVEVLDYPVAANGKVCVLEGVALDGSVVFNVTGQSCPGFAPISATNYQPGKLQVGLANTGLGLISLYSTVSDPTGTRDVVTFVPYLEPVVSCSNACGEGAKIEQLWPAQTASGALKAELLCQPFDGGVSDRWWAVIDPSGFRCIEQRVDRQSRKFLDARLDHPRPSSRSGGYARYQANFATGNGQAWLKGEAGNSFLQAESWFVDRPPLALGVFTIGVLPDGGLNRVTLSSTGNTTAALTSAGFLAESQPLGIVAGVITRAGLVGFTTSGELQLPLDGRVLARVSLFPFPQEADQQAIVAPRPGGAQEWVVSVNDQIFTGTASNSGRVVDLLPAARPAPGFPIISMAAASQSVPGGETVEFYAATRSNVFRVYLDGLNRWRFDEISLGTNSDFVKVWMTQRNRARVGDRAGNVFSLPSGLALAHGLTRPAEDFLSTCGRDIALFSDDAYALGPADGGRAEWRPLGLTPDLFEGGRMFEVDDGFLVFGARGEVQRVSCTP